MAANMLSALSCWRTAGLGFLVRDLTASARYFLRRFFMAIFYAIEIVWKKSRLDFTGHVKRKNRLGVNLFY